MAKVIIHDGVDLKWVEKVVSQYLALNQEGCGLRSLCAFRLPDGINGIGVYRTKAGALVLRPSK